MKLVQELISRRDGRSVTFELDLEELTVTTTAEGETETTSYASLETLVFGYERAARALFADETWVDVDGRENPVLDLELDARRHREAQARSELGPVEAFGRHVVDQLRETIYRTREIVGENPIDEIVFFFEEFHCRRVEYNVDELPFEGPEELRRLSWRGLREEGTAAIAPDGDFYVELESSPTELDELLDGTLQLYDVPFIVSWAAAQLEPEVGFPIYVTFIDDGSIDFGARERAVRGEPLASFLRRGE